MVPSIAPDFCLLLFPEQLSSSKLPHGPRWLLYSSHHITFQPAVGRTKKMRSKGLLLPSFKAPRSCYRTPPLTSEQPELSGVAALVAVQALFWTSLCPAKSEASVDLEEGDTTIEERQPCLLLWMSLLSGCYKACHLFSLRSPD